MESRVVQLSARGPTHTAQGVHVMEQSRALAGHKESSRLRENPWLGQEAHSIPLLLIQLIW